MAFHPQPSTNMLLPIMHPNTSQISRWCVAAIIITRSLDPLPFQHIFSAPATNTPPTSLNKISMPYDLEQLRPNRPLSLSPIIQKSQDSSLVSHLPQMSRHRSYPISQRMPNIKTKSKSTLIPTNSFRSRPPILLDTTPLCCNISSSHIVHPSILPDLSNLHHPDFQKKHNSLTQSSIKKWTVHSPFIPNIPSLSSSPGTSSVHPIDTSPPSHPRQHYSSHLSPFGTPLPIIDPKKILRVCVQNTQHDFKIYSDGLELTSIIEHLQNLAISMFVPISPNVNWKNHSNWSCTHQLFCQHFHHVHISAISSDIGLQPLYLNKHLVAGTVILSFGLWASKVIPGPQDDSGYGTFSVTTIQGKGGKHVSFISAYIAVNKGGVPLCSTMHNP
jgi:hypothetical protein